MTKPEDIKQDTEKPMREYAIYGCSYCGHKYAVSWKDIVSNKNLKLLNCGFSSIEDCPRCGLKGTGVEVVDVFGNQKGYFL